MGNSPDNRRKLFQRAEPSTPRIAHTIRQGGGKSGFGKKQNWDTYMINGKIRRLTPTECMRLMSWPDDWCDFGIDEKGNKVAISDSQKYKMAGNGIVSNVVSEIVKNLINPLL